MEPEKFKMGHVTLLGPFQRQYVIYWLELAMINLYTKYEVYVYTLRIYERRHMIDIVGWFVG